VDKKRTTTITSETHEVLIVRRRFEPSMRMWCDECGAEVEMLKPEEAAAIANVSTRTIYRWIESAQIHHAESVGGNVIVCPNQLFG
jgi:hypothetical protein